MPDPPATTSTVKLDRPAGVGLLLDAYCSSAGVLTGFVALR
jgi:hypothetical protein